MIKSILKNTWPDIHLTLSGAIKDSGPMPEIPQNIPGRLTIDLEGLTAINSTGGRIWSGWISNLSVAKGIILTKCSPSFIHQMNVLVGFVGPNARVESFFVPYYCASCGADKAILYEVPPSVKTPADLKIKESLTCSACAKDMQFDVVKERYFNFISRMAGS